MRQTGSLIRDKHGAINGVSRAETMNEKQDLQGLQASDSLFVEQHHGILGASLANDCHTPLRGGNHKPETVPSNWKLPPVNVSERGGMLSVHISASRQGRHRCRWMGWIGGERRRG